MPDHATPEHRGRTTGAIVDRVVAEQLGDTRLDDLFDIGVDEVAYRKQHHYLTLIANHDTGEIVWAAKAATPPH